MIAAATDERIETLTEMLRELWRLHPHSRLGQLIVDYVVGGTLSPMYFIDDATFEQRLCLALAPDPEVP